ncbi:shikimate kinase [Marinilabiliaceae bacterium JC017]|nr:shikimate kinase [Marinilabiliaceae bacterium JC017]
MKLERVYLIGFMGSGKSTLGRQLAKELQWAFVDLDDYFEEKYQTTISNYFSTEGETAFRQAEHQVLQEVTKLKNTIIATGGGAPCYFNNMETMNKTGLSIYLKLTPQVIKQRLATSNQVRPLILGKSGQELIDYITQKLAERAPFYEKARVIADAEALTVEGYLKIIRNKGLLTL